MGMEQVWCMIIGAITTEKPDVRNTSLFALQVHQVDKVRSASRLAGCRQQPRQRCQNPTPALASAWRWRSCLGHRTTHLPHKTSCLSWMLWETTASRYALANQVAVFPVLLYAAYSNPQYASQLRTFSSQGIGICCLQQSGGDFCRNGLMTRLHADHEIVKKKGR